MKRTPKPPMPCKCGCGRLTVYPVRFATEECRAIGKRASMDRNNARRREKNATGAKPATVKAESKPRDHSERFGLKPHRPDPPPLRKVMSEEEQARLAEEQRRLDAEVNSRLVKASLGLEVRKDCPLASEVVRPPKEVWKEYEAKWKPLTQTEREFNLPLRSDISYY